MTLIFRVLELPGDVLAFSINTMLRGRFARYSWEGVKR